MSFPSFVRVGVIVLMLVVENFQTFDPTTMLFPAEMLVDYVHQRQGPTNIGCKPKAYPTADYISNHLDAYQSKPVLSFVTFLRY
jgi:hypothetical protein